MIKLVPAMRPCDCESIGDFHRYYRYAWLAWYGELEPEPRMVQQTDPENQIVFLTRQSGMTDHVRWRDLMNRCSFGMPELGMVNGDHSILYMWQTAPRVAQKGFRPNGVQYAVFNAWDLRKNGKSPDPSNITVIKNLFLPTYYTVEEALKSLESGERVGCALSNKMGLYTTATDKYPMIAYRRNTIGHMRDGVAHVARLYADAAMNMKKKLNLEVVLL